MTEEKEERIGKGIMGVIAAIFLAIGLGGLLVAFVSLVIAPLAGSIFAGILWALAPFSVGAGFLLLAAICYYIRRKL